MNCVTTYRKETFWSLCVLRRPNHQLTQQHQGDVKSTVNKS